MKAAFAGMNLNDTSKQLYFEPSAYERTTTQKVSKGDEEPKWKAKVENKWGTTGYKETTPE
jgi:hypothetical protein